MSKYNLYLNLIKQTQDEYGFIMSSHCDAVLFSGLVGCVPGVKVDLDKAFDKDTGQWHRRPCDKPCFPAHSASTISRDMLLGILFFAAYNNRLDISEQIIKYALSNFGIMGQAKDLKTLLGRCLISPGLLGTAAWISYKLGGPSRPWLRLLPVSPSKHVVGFQAHLTVLHILLRNKLTNKNNYKEVLDFHFKRQPNNPLFAMASGNYNAAESILKDSSLWPEDRLPTNRDRKSGWLIERDYGDSWKPDLDDTNIIVYPGGDYLFLKFLLKQLSEEN